FSSRRRHTRSKRDWSSDVCSSDLNSKIGDTPVRGNFGAQLVHAQQSTTGFCPGCGGGQPVSGGTSYNDVLPSANIIFDLTPDVRSEERRVGKESRCRWQLD